MKTKKITLHNTKNWIDVVYVLFLNQIFIMCFDEKKL
jgi:hypothetical protein